jgi:hypothetical protein
MPITRLLRSSSSHRFVFAAALVSAAALALTTPIAQAQCHPPANSHEARLLAFYSVPVAFSADPAAITEPPRSLRLALEGALVPQPSADLQHTEYCYTGRAQNTSLTRVFGRPRLSVSLPGGAGLEVSYLPPITVANATPNLFAAAAWIARPLPYGTLALRVHAMHGTVRGPITCPASGLQQSDPNAPCYGTSPSRDEFRPTTIGVELLGISRPLDAAGRVRASLGAGVNLLRPRFRVGFSDLLGGTDHTTIDVNLTRAVALAGLDVRAGSRCTASAQGYASFTDAATVRAIVGCALLR